MHAPTRGSDARHGAHRPAAVLCTHFLPAQLLSSLRKKSATLARTLPLALVLTDLDAQSMWVYQGVDRYFAPRLDAAHVLRAYGVRPSAISISGIPIMPSFAAGADATRRDALGRFGLDPDDKRPVVTLLSSGAKLMLAAMEQLLACATPLRVLALMGRQADVSARLLELDVPARHSLRPLTYVSEMPLLLRATDLLVGKSGGLIIAEAAALSVPMVILDPIPGQETRNADVVLAAGAALKVNDLPLLARTVDAALDGGRREAMARAMGGLGRPDAAFEVADALLDGTLRAPPDDD